VRRGNEPSLVTLGYPSSFLYRNEECLGREGVFRGGISATIDRRSFNARRRG